MNRLLKITFYGLLLMQVACYPKDQKEKPEQVDLENLRKDTGGSPDETTTQGTGIFFSYDQNCTAGFGICDIDLAQPNPANEGTEETPRRGQGIRNKATFYMSTREGNDSLRIEFSEQIPQFEDNFNLGHGDTLRNAFGYEYVILKKGNYPSSRNVGNYGAVTIPVIKGPKRSNYK